MAAEGGEAPAAFKMLSNLALGNTINAAARDYKRELESAQGKAAKSGSPPQDELDLDDLADDPELDRLHGERLAAIKREAERRAGMERKGHGEYREVEEGSLLPEVTGSHLVACHFFHKDFSRCKILDMHLKKLSEKYGDTKFLKVEAEKCPFFVVKLGVRTLPCLILFRDGVAFDRVVGFKELGERDDFPTSALEARLLSAGIVRSCQKKVGYGGEDDEDDEDDDDDRNRAGYGGRSGVVNRRSIRGSTEHDDSNSD